MTVLLLAMALSARVTAYAPGCGATGLTRALTRPTAGRTIAADWTLLPKGTAVNIHGLGPFIVEDTGEEIQGTDLDVYMATCDEAIQWGTRQRAAYVLPRPVSREEWRQLRRDIAEARRPLAPVTPLAPMTAQAMPWWLRCWLGCAMAMAVISGAAGVRLILWCRHPATTMLK